MFNDGAKIIAMNFADGFVAVFYGCCVE